jgi:transposase
MDKPKKKRVRRPAKRLPQTAQGSLFPEALAEQSAPKPLSPTIEFLNPPPEAIFIGEAPLRQYLRQNGLTWVIRLRRLLAKSDLSGFVSAYDPQGRKAIHPVVMLGLIVYGILERRWSLRDLESLARRDVGAWWLCGGLQPDHSTIGKFIQLHRAVLSEPYFVDLTRLLVKKLRLPAGEVAGDGTVMEAAASRYRALQAEAAQQAAAEAKAAARADDAAAQAQVERAEQAAAVAEERAAKCKQSGGNPKRVRVNPTEPEAVFQPRKDGARRFCYKPSVLVNAERLIVGQHLHPSNEGTSITPMLNQYHSLFASYPPRTLLDGNYHCAEVLGLFVNLELDLLCPPGKADLGQWQKQYRAGKFPKNAFAYEEEHDVYRCPAGHPLPATQRGKDSWGGEYQRYGGAPCHDCPLRARCTTAKGGRTIKRYASDEWKEAMAQVFAHERARRCYRHRREWVEPVFAEFRERQGLTRFHRRGLAGVRVEFSLHTIAYNLKRTISLEAQQGLLVFITAQIWAENRLLGAGFYFLCLKTP